MIRQRCRRFGLLITTTLLGAVALAPAPASGAYRDVVLADNPESYFRMDDAGAPTMNNETAAADGTHVTSATGPTFGVGGALASETPNLSVGYQDDEADSSTFSVTAPYDDFTIEFWVFSPAPNPAPAATQWWQGRGLVDGDISTPANDTGIAIIQGGKVGFGLGNPDVTIGSATAVDDAAWHHVVATSDGNGLMFLFVDGVQEGSFGSAPAADRTNTGLTIGRLNFPSGNGEVLGFLDEVAFYSHDLAAADVSEHYHAAFPPPAPPPAAPCRKFECMSPADRKKLSDFFASMGKGVSDLLNQIEKKLPPKPVTVTAPAPPYGFFNFKWGFNFKGAGGASAAKGKKKPVVLGETTATPTQSGQVSATLTFNPAGVKKLLKAGKANVTLTQTFTDTGGVSIAETSALKFKAKKKKR